MRIGFDAKRLFLNDRGLGNYSRNLLTGFTKYQAQHDYFLYTPKFSNRFISSEMIEHPNVHVELPRGFGQAFGGLWRSLGLGSAASINNLDVFHGLSHEIPFDCKKIQAKLVVTIHDLIFVKHPEFYKPIDRWIYYKKLSYAIRHADKIVAISNQTKNDILTEFEISEERVEVVYQSCDEVFYEKRTNEELSSLKLRGNLPDRYLLFVGALNENKNIIMILKAIKILRDPHKIPLVVVGKGTNYRKQLEDYAVKNGLENQLHFVNDNFDPTPIELSCIYQLASAFILPSFYEGFGIPILEARFSHIPVFASNSSCLEEAGGAESYYFDPDNAEQLAHLIEQLDKGLLIHDLTPPSEYHARALSNKMMNLYHSLA